MLTVFEDEDKLLAAFKAGARGYVLKGVSARDLANVVRNTANGEVYVSPSLAAGMLMTLTRGRPGLGRRRRRTRSPHVGRSWPRPRHSGSRSGH